MNVPEILKNFNKEIPKIADLLSLDELQIKYLGRNGQIKKLLENLKKLPPEKKKKEGVKINGLKKEIEKKLFEKKKELLQKKEAGLKVDVTLPGKKYPRGSYHPVSIAINEIVRIFEEIGFARVSYPEVEWEYFSFESLNMPPGHPARDDFETFFAFSGPQMSNQMGTVEDFATGRDLKSF